MDLVVYTSIFGGIKDQLRSPALGSEHSLEFIAFLDDKACELNDSQSVWKTRHAKFDHPISRRKARAHKVLVHRIFPEYKYSLWIDGCLQLINKEFEKQFDAYLTDSDICTFRHRRRNCVYEEVLACIEQEKDNKTLMIKQAARYKSEGYPINNGLAETTAVLRRHNATTSKFNEMWWEEIQNGSCRDQLSFDYVAWKLGVKYQAFEGTVDKNPFFSWFRH